MHDQTREIPIQTRLAPVASVNADTRTAELVWSKGAQVMRSDFWTGNRYIEELSMDPSNIRMDRLQNGAPLLNTHGRYALEDVIGVVETASVSNGEGLATVRFSDREDVNGIWRDVQNGIIRNVSVGYSVHKYQIEERDNALPIWRAVDWEPMEISLVPVGADAGAGIRSDHSSRMTRCIFETFNREVQNVENVENEIEIRNQPNVDTPIPDHEIIRKSEQAAIKAERSRCNEIREAVRAGGFEESLSEELINRGITADEARREVLKQLSERTASPAPRGRVEAGGLDETQTRREAMADAIAHRMNPSGQLAEPAREYRHFSLLRMAEESLIRSGERVRGLAPMEIASRAMLSTSDFPSIMANVMNKRLRMAYEQSPPTYRMWASRAPNAPDFKSIDVAQLSGAPDLLQVDEHGEFKYGPLSDGKESYSVATYGRIIAITRQTLINDDLRALDRIPRAFGMAASRLENRLVYAQLTGNAALSDGIALFHASHGNLASSGGAVSVTTLAAGRAAMRAQKGLQSEVLNIAPSFIIAPAALEQVVYQYTSANYVPAKSSDINEFRSGGMTALTPVIEAELDATSTTGWYLAAMSGIVDTIEYAYLEGNEGVYIESGIGFDTDGIKVKARLDFATKSIDYRGLYKNAGA